MEQTASIGELIKYYRQNAGLSQAELARNICAREYIGKIEQDKCSPTIDMINQLSNKLHVNLYDNYALVLEHHNLETHTKITELNEAIFQRNFSRLYDLTEKYSTLHDFTYGTPFLYLKYSQALVFSHISKDYAAAAECASSALAQENIDISTPCAYDSLSNAPLLLIHSAAVNLCRIEAYSDGEVYFHFLDTYLKKIISQNAYLVNRNKRFELNMLAHAAYNEYVFLPHQFESHLALLDSTLAILKQHNMSNMVPELLLCKAHLLRSFHHDKEALDLYLQAHYMGLYGYEPSKLEELEQTILDTEYAYFLQSGAVVPSV